MTTLAEVQQLWRERWAEPRSERPSCYNRPEWVSVVRSKQFFNLDYPFRMSDGCPHWKPGGNAHVRAWCDSAGGKRTPWSACHGCKWKGAP